MGAAPEHGAADTNRVVHAARSRMPFALCVTVGSESGLEQRSVFRTADQVANVTTKIGSKVRRGGDRQEMPVGMVAEVEGRKTPRCQFRFAMARRHEEHKAIDASREQPLKLRSNQAMVAGGTIAGKCVYSKS